jgi:hypothetical protein
MATSRDESGPAATPIAAGLSLRLSWWPARQASINRRPGRPLTTSRPAHVIVGSPLVLRPTLSPARSLMAVGAVQPFIIDNGPRSGRNIATEAVVRAIASGCMLLACRQDVAVWPSCNASQDSVNYQNYDSKKPCGLRNIDFAGEMQAGPIAAGVSGGYGDDDRDRTFLWGKGA